MVQRQSLDARNARRRQRRAERVAEAAAEAEAKRQYEKGRRSLYYKLKTCIDRGGGVGVSEASRDLNTFKANRHVFLEQKTKELFKTMMTKSNKPGRGKENSLVAPPVPIHNQLSLLGRPATDQELAVLQSSYENDQNRALLSQVAHNALSTTGSITGSIMGNVSSAVSNLAGSSSSERPGSL